MAMDGQFMPLKTPTCELQSKDDDDTRLLLLNGLLESILYPVTIQLLNYFQVIILKIP